MKPEIRTSIAELAAAAVLLFGVALFVHGVWLAWRPGGWMAAGVAIAAPALFLLYGTNRKTRAR